METLQMDLEEEILVMTAKEMRRQALKQKLDTLLGSEIEVSYDLNLTKAEQVKYATIGAFHYWCDLNGKSKTYLGKERSSEDWKIEKTETRDYDEDYLDLDPAGSE